ncbi:hypothetical protein GCM10027361_17300 [Erwinia aphidicola]
MDVCSRLRAAAVVAAGADLAAAADLMVVSAARAANFIGGLFWPPFF